MKGTEWLPGERVGAAEAAAIANGSVTSAAHCGCIASEIGDEPTIGISGALMRAVRRIERSNGKARLASSLL